MGVAGELSGEDAAGKESLPSEPHIVGYCPEKQNAYILGKNGRRHFAASLAQSQEQLLVEATFKNVDSGGNDLGPVSLPATNKAMNDWRQMVASKS